MAWTWASSGRPPPSRRQPPLPISSRYNPLLFAPPPECPAPAYTRVPMISLLFALPSSNAPPPVSPCGPPYIAARVVVSQRALAGYYPKHQVDGFIRIDQGQARESARPSGAEAPRRRIK